MLGLTKKTDYGLELMIALARNYGSRPVSLRRVAKENQLPYAFLAQVAIPLKEAGLIEAKEGVAGGFYLGYAPGEISLKDVIEVLQGMGNEDCAVCGRGKICQPKKVWQEIEEILNKEFRKKTLRDYI